MYGIPTARRLLFSSIFCLFFKEEEGGYAHGNVEKTVPFSSGAFHGFHSDREPCNTHEGDEKGIQNFNWKTRRGVITCEI